jgi:hypothetical protein
MSYILVLIWYFSGALARICTRSGGWAVSTFGGVKEAEYEEIIVVLIWYFEIIG